jgi:hypothetical protein
MEISLGAMGGGHYMAARSVNVHQELLWLAIPNQMHSDTVAKFRLIEQEALNQLNARKPAA